jgi:hypothetical protein
LLRGRTIGNGCLPGAYYFLYAKGLWKRGTSFATFVSKAQD